MSNSATTWTPSSRQASNSLILFTRAIRAFADGYIAVLLPAFMLALGHSQWQIGLLSSVALMGSAILTMALGVWGYHVHSSRILGAAAILMAMTGLSFATTTVFWLLLVVAFLGTINPSAGDVSVFGPLEQVHLADTAQGHAQVALLARYSLVGVFAGAFGALVSALPTSIHGWTGTPEINVMRGMFLLYSGFGVALWFLYRHPSLKGDIQTPRPKEPLGESRRRVLGLAALFSLDAFGGGLVVNPLLALWLFKRFDMSLELAGLVLFVSGVLTACSQLAAPRLAERLGLLNAMVYTHVPANLFLIAAALAPRLELALGLLFLRSLLSHMDVPARTAFVIQLIRPEERAAALTLTSVTRNVAAALSPALGGLLLSKSYFVAPLALCGVLKLFYDLILWRAYRYTQINASN
ncbi:MAG: MFS transporter [Gammaproteobacteria bacterium]|nr:MFS transporter [Gammaproteobacteria bacterium]